MRDGSLKDFVLDQMASLPGVRARGMFGGWGLYLDGEFFGMIWKGSLFFRTDGESRPAYRERGSRPIPFGNDPGSNRYWEVPADVLEEAPLLAAWARTAAATPRADPGPRKPRRSPKGKAAGPRSGKRKVSPAAPPAPPPAGPGRRRGTRGGPRSTSG